MVQGWGWGSAECSVLSGTYTAPTSPKAYVNLTEARVICKAFSVTVMEETQSILGGAIPGLVVLSSIGEWTEGSHGSHGSRPVSSALPRPRPQLLPSGYSPV